MFGGSTKKINKGVSIVLVRLRNIQLPIKITDWVMLKKILRVYSGGWEIKQIFSA